MNEHEPQRCPTCGQITENRVIPLHETMVIALYRVWKWSREHNKVTFERKEIDHLLAVGTMYATFGNLVHFGGIMFKEGKGHWGINDKRAEEFFENKYQVPSKVVIDRKTRQIISRGDPLLFRDVPFLVEFLNDEYKYVPQYTAQ